MKFVSSPTKAEGALLTEVKAKLITKEDPLHVHKTLGILCLISYGWRFSLGARETDMGFAIYSHWTLPTIFLHLALNVSSFEFRLPTKRILSGYRIWPEYRLHSLVFLCRSLAIMTVRWYEQTYNVIPNTFPNLVIVMTAMVAADIGSYSIGKPNQSGFSRNLQVHHSVKYFFSVMQLVATAGCLYIVGRYSLHYFFCMIIQCNAFLMTLRRKNLAGHYVLISLYAVMLLAGWIVGLGEMMRYGWRSLSALTTVAYTAVLLRLAPSRLPGPLQLLHNKYVLWPVCYALMVMLRPLESEDATVRETAVVPLTDNQLFYSAVAVTVGVLVLGYYKVTYEYPAREEASAAAAAAAAAAAVVDTNDGKKTT